MPLVRVEAEEVAGAASIGSPPASTRTSPATTSEERGLLHLVVAQLLAGLERDQHDAALAVLRVEHDRRARAVGRVDLVELPVLHAGSVSAAARALHMTPLHSPA